MMISTAITDLGKMLDSLGWAIFHSIWQCVIAAIIVVLFRALTRDNQATLRYSFQLLTLFGCLAAVIVTFFIYQLRSSGVNAAGGGGSALTTISSFFGTPVLPSGARSPGGFTPNLTPFAPILGILWCFGFAAIAMRYLGAFAITQHLRRRGLSAVPAPWARRFETLVLNSGIRRRVTFYVSNRIKSPLTLGFFKPIVLVPSSFFTGLSPEQMEAILLHEIAHIRRHDYLINLFQTVIRTIFFFHPAVYFISRLIDNDREHACDDFAVAQTKNPKALARALVALRLGATPNRFALAADNGNTPLVARLNRLGYGATSRRRPEQAAASVGTLIVTAALIPVANSYADAKPIPPIQSEFNLSHPSEKLGNYTFKKIRKNNRDVTVKVASDGSRWVNVNGLWHDVDKAPHRITELPAIPAAPEPPENVNDAGQLSQYRIDRAYYEARVELETASTSNAKPTTPNKPLPKYDASKVDAHMRSLRQKREAAFLRTHQSREKLGKALTQVGGPKIIPIATLQTENMSTRWEHKPQKALELPHNNARRTDNLADAEDWLGDFVTQMVEIETNKALKKISHIDAETARKKAEKRLENRIQQSQKIAQHAQQRGQSQNFEQFNKDVLRQLRLDRLVSESATAATITYPNGHMTVNGYTVPDHLADNYCGIMQSYGIQKRRDARIEIAESSFTYRSNSGTPQPVMRGEGSLYKPAVISASSWAVPAHVKPVISYDFNYKIDQLKTRTEASNKTLTLRYSPKRETSIGQQKALLSPN